MPVSNSQILRALIAKDWRLFRVPMVAMIICGIGVYLLATVAIVEASREHSGDPSYLIDQDGYGSAQLIFTLNTVYSNSFGGAVLTGFIACALGGVAIAGERADRTGDFVGLLPVTRGQMILSKLTTSALMLSLFTAIHMLIGTTGLLVHGWIHGGGSTPGGIPLGPIVQAAVWWIGITTCLFGVGWLFSTFLASGPLSASISIAVTAVAMLAIPLTMGDLIDRHQTTPQHAQMILAAIAFCIGLPSLLGGVLYYLKRIAP